jgi:hypothetical protein
MATGLIVYTSIVYKKEKPETEKKEEDETVIKQICKIIDTIGLVCYFLISFTTGAWHITWIIFLINGLCESVAKLIYGLKEKEGGKENE